MGKIPFDGQTKMQLPQSMHSSGLTITASQSLRRLIAQGMNRVQGTLRRTQKTFTHASVITSPWSG